MSIFGWFGSTSASSEWFGSASFLQRFLLVPPSKGFRSISGFNFDFSSSRPQSRGLPCSILGDNVQKKRRCHHCHRNPQISKLSIKHELSQKFTERKPASQSGVCPHSQESVSPIITNSEQASPALVFVDSLAVKTMLQSATSSSSSFETVSVFAILQSPS